MCGADYPTCSTSSPLPTTISESRPVCRTMPPIADFRCKLSIKVVVKMEQSCLIYVPGIVGSFLGNPMKRDPPISEIRICHAQNAAYSNSLPQNKFLSIACTVGSQVILGGWRLTNEDHFSGTMQTLL